MKIKNEKLEITGEDGTELTIAQIMMIPVNGMVPQGMDIAEMRKRIAIIEVLDSAGDEFELDEEQTVFMRQLWSAHRWKAAHPDILKVDEAVSK